MSDEPDIDTLGIKALKDERAVHLSRSQTSLLTHLWDS